MRFPPAVLTLVSIVMATFAASPAPADVGPAALDRAAACIISADRRHSAALAEAVPDSEADRSAWSALAEPVGRCLARAGITDNADIRSLLAGQIAERLYVRSTSSFSSRVVSTSTTTTAEIPAVPPLSERTADWPGTAAMAECVSNALPNEVDALIRARPGSDQEGRAMAAIRPALPGCVNQGQQVAVGRGRLRAELARAFYRHIFAPITRVMPFLPQSCPRPERDGVRC